MNDKHKGSHIGMDVIDEKQYSLGASLQDISLF